MLTIVETLCVSMDMIGTLLYMAVLVVIYQAFKIQKQEIDEAKKDIAEIQEILKSVVDEE